MKKKLSALLCALCMAMALCLTAFAAGTPVLSATATRSGSTVTLTLDMNSNDNALQGLQCNVTYDADTLEFDKDTASANGIYGVADLTPKGDGVVQVLAFNNSGSATKDSGVVATLTFKVKEGKTGTTTFGVDAVKVPDENSKPATVETDLSKASVEVADPKPEVKEYPVTVNQTGKGTVTLTDKATGEVIASGSNVKENTEVVVKAEAAEGYTLDADAIEVNGAKINSGDSLTITAETKINVTFTEKTPVNPDPVYYNITVAPYENGKVEVQKTSEANKEVTVTATPDEGYVAKISVTTKSGATVAVKDAKFTMPAEDVTVTVTFTKKATDPSEKPSTSPSTNPSTSSSTKPSTTNKPSNKTTTVTATATPAPTAQAKPAAAIPQTGDTANLALYAVLCVASAMALGYVVYRKKANH